MSLSVLRHGKNSPPKDTYPDLSGKTIVITGSSTGLGLEASIKFAKCKASRLILAVRSIEKGNVARTRILTECEPHKPQIDVWELDMLDYGSIHSFAKRVDQNVDRLDIAVLNAGVAPKNYARSPYGFEMNLQINVLSTQLLALLLLPKLRSSTTQGFTPVLEIVTSGNHKLVKLDAQVEDLQKDPLEAYIKPENFDFQKQYNVSKLYAMYVVQGLAKQTISATTGKPEVHVVAICPGFCQSELGRDHTGAVMGVLKFIMAKTLQRTTEEGSRTHVSGVALGEKGHGRFWTNDEIEEPIALLSGARGEKLTEFVWESTTSVLTRENINAQVVDLQH